MSTGGSALFISQCLSGTNGLAGSFENDGGSVNRAGGNMCDFSRPGLRLALPTVYHWPKQGCGHTSSQGVNSAPSEAIARVWRKQGVKKVIIGDSKSTFSLHPSDSWLRKCIYLCCLCPLRTAGYT